MEIIQNDLTVYGAHRAIEPMGALPQSALRVDNTPNLLNPHELLIDVQSLMLDSTSMRQIMEASHHNPERASEKIMSVVSQCGKMHNPETHSGGVLIGGIQEIGSRFFEIHEPPSKDKIAGQTIIPVASLSALPLNLRRVKAIQGDRVAVEGSAIMFACMKICPLPEDFSPELALACVDISSLPPQVNRCLASLISNKDDILRILILGCGKAGITALYCIRDFEKRFRQNTPSLPRFQVLAVDSSAARVGFASRLRLADATAQMDARNAGELYSFVRSQTKNSLCDLVINVVNTPNTEAPTILCARERPPKGFVLWFSMATRFDQAALATDALGKDIIMTIGNGVADGQIEEIFTLVRGNFSLRSFLEDHPS